MLLTHEQDQLTTEDRANLGKMGDRLAPPKTPAQELAEAIAASLQTWIDVPMAQGPYSPLPLDYGRAGLIGGVAA